MIAIFGNNNSDYKVSLLYPKFLSNIFLLHLFFGCEREIKRERERESKKEPFPDQI